MKRLNPPQRETVVPNKWRQDTDKILARHLGKPEDLAAKVFRPKEPKALRASALKALEPTDPTPALPAAVGQVLVDMAADLKGLRSAVEVMADQLNKLVALGDQQIDAIARLPPALHQSSEGLADGLQQVAHAIRSLSHRPLPAAYQHSLLGIDMKLQQLPDVDEEPEAAPQLDVKNPQDEPQRKRQKKWAAGHFAPAPIVAKSIADAKRPNRFYTTIRLSRELWNEAGLGPESRIQVDWKKKQSVSAVSRMVA